MTYTSRNLDIGDGEVRLRRSIELENQKALQEMKKSAEQRIMADPDLSREEEFKLMLKKAKQDNSQKENEVLFD